jgi:hypothetical protein
MKREFGRQSLGREVLLLGWNIGADFLDRECVAWLLNHDGLEKAIRMADVEVDLLIN